MTRCNYGCWWCLGCFRCLKHGKHRKDCRDLLREQARRFRAAARCLDGEPEQVVTERLP